VGRDKANGDNRTAERVLTFAILTMNYKVLNNYSRRDKYNVEE